MEVKRGSCLHNLFIRLGLSARCITLSLSISAWDHLRRNGSARSTRGCHVRVLQKEMHSCTESLVPRRNIRISDSGLLVRSGPFSLAFPTHCEKFRCFASGYSCILIYCNPLSLLLGWYYSSAAFDLVMSANPRGEVRKYPNKRTEN